MKHRREDSHRPDDEITGAEPLDGSGFEQELPETDFNGDPEESREPEREDEK
jgi:hypothetical protein